MRTHLIDLYDRPIKMQCTYLHFLIWIYIVTLLNKLNRKQIKKNEAKIVTSSKFCEM